MGYSWDFSGVLHFLPAFGNAVLVTLALTLLSSVIGTLMGLPLVVLLRCPLLIRAPFVFVVDALRAIPNLVLIFFFYYFPYRELIGIEPFSPFLSALAALVVAQAAYSADAFRSALDQASRSQILAVRAIGYKERHVIWFVIIPSLVRQTLPIHIALWIGNLKLSSLASVIGVEDVVFVAKVSMTQSYRSLEAWIFVAAIYVLLVLPATYGLRFLERSSWIARQ